MRIKTLSFDEIESLLKKHQLDKLSKRHKASKVEPEYSATGLSYVRAIRDHILDDSKQLPLSVDYFRSKYASFKASNLSPNSIKKYFAALRVLVQYVDVEKQELFEVLNEIMSENNSVINDLKDQGEWSEKDLENYIPYDDIIGGVEVYTEEHFKQNKMINMSTDQMCKLIVCRLLVIDNFYAPRRNEFLSLQFMNASNANDEGVNLINLSNGECILRDFKTFKSKGEYRFKVSNTTLKMIKKLQIHRGKKEAKYLFPTWATRSAQSNIVYSAFQHVLNTKKNLGVDLLRRLYYETEEFTTWRAQEIIANRLGHSVEESLRTYNRIHRTNIPLTEE